MNTVLRIRFSPSWIRGWPIGSVLCRQVHTHPRTCSGKHCAALPRVRHVSPCSFRQFANSAASGKESSYGPHADRTTLEGDIYEEQPEEEDTVDEEPDEAEAAIRRGLLDAALQFVPEYGWSKKAVVAGAEALGLPPTSHGLVDGPIELVHHFYASANQELAQLLANEVREVEEGIREKRSTGVFIQDALQTRLKLMIPYLSTWPQAMGLMALPQNVPQSLQHLNRLVDDIWYYAGDRSVDFNWYTKRTTLAAVYSSTVLYMVQDSSPDFHNTWAFMKRRLEDLALFGKANRQVQQASGVLGDLVLGASIVGRNIIGWNDRHR